MDVYLFKDGKGKYDKSFGGDITSSQVYGHKVYAAPRKKSILLVEAIRIGGPEQPLKLKAIEESGGTIKDVYSSEWMLRWRVRFIAKDSIRIDSKELEAGIRKSHSFSLALKDWSLTEIK